MKFRVPHYYKDFSCIASKCQDNCCVGGWQIDIDEETAKYYESITGSFGTRLKEAVSCEDGEYCFKLVNGKCPFLDSDNLCEIYKELGEEHMGVVCTQFPRFTEYYGSIKETGIGLACEEAARIILSDDKPFSLDESDIDENGITDGEYDAELGEALFTIRAEFMKLFEDISLNLYTKLQIMLNACETIQSLINNNAYNEIAEYCQQYNYKTACDNTFFTDKNMEFTTEENVQNNAEDDVARIIYPYLELEILNDEWKNAIEHTVDVLHPDKDNLKNEQVNEIEEKYSRISREFEVFIASESREYNNLIKYYIYRYLCKTAFDHDILGKIQLIIANLLVIRDMDMTMWLDNNKNLSYEDRSHIIHIFSRQIEYSEDNLFALYDEFLFDDIFNADNLRLLLDKMGCLLEYKI